MTFTGGLVFEWNVTRNFHFQMNLLYKGKGDRIAMANFAESLDLPPVNNHVLSAEGEGFVSRTVHYAEFSLIPTLSFPSASGKSKFLLGLGGYYGSAISGSKNADYTLRFYQDGELTTEDIVDETKDMVIVDLFPTDNNPDEIYIRRFDYGMHGLIGWRMPKLMYGLSTSLGMVEIEPDELFARKIKPRETRHVVVTLFFSYYFTS